MNKYKIQEKLYSFLGLFFITTPIFAEPLTAGAIMGISAGISLLTGGAGALGAGAQKRKAERRERAARARRQVLEANRQDPIDPYRDLQNPFANLQIATQANIMQAEQADISLASSLDTLRATGASAGGATALARAAMQSKRGVSASIEQQEAKNAQLRAQGEIKTAQMRGQGEMFKYQATEAREMQELDRAASLESSYNQQAAAYSAQGSAMLGQAVGGIAKAGLAGVQAGVFKGTSGTTPPIDDAVVKPADLIVDSSISDIRTSAYANPYAPPIGEDTSLSDAYTNAYANPYAPIIGGVTNTRRNNSWGGQSQWGGSDRRLKKNIKLISISPQGLKIYAFEYINKVFGEGVYQGVMSDEIPQYAVIKHTDGYDRVDYSKLDVTFKQI